MWFVFPQLRGLGQSPTARHFGIEGREEATAYARHEVLGERLILCAEIVWQSDVPSAHAIFGSPDDVKLRSCMTLFKQVSEKPIFQSVLDRFYGGEDDERTIELLGLEPAVGGAT